MHILPHWLLFLAVAVLSMHREIHTHILIMPFNCRELRDFITLIRATLPSATMPSFYCCSSGRQFIVYRRSRFGARGNKHQFVNLEVNALNFIFFSFLFNGTIPNADKQSVV
jgi:hypothetical protein